MCKVKCKAFGWIEFPEDLAVNKYNAFMPSNYFWDTASAN